MWGGVLIVGGGGEAGGDEIEWLGRKAGRDKASEI